MAVCVNVSDIRFVLLNKQIENIRRKYLTLLVRKVRKTYFD